MSIAKRLNSFIEGMEQGMVLQSHVRIRRWAFKLEVAAGNFVKQFFLILNFWFESVGQMIKKRCFRSVFLVFQVSFSHDIVLLSNIWVRLA